MEFRRVLFRSFEHRTARVAERVDASRVAVECVQGGLETFACSAEAHVQRLGEAQERLNALELLSNRMLDRVAHSGIRTPDTPYLEPRSEEHTSELQSLMRITYAVIW